MLTLAHSSYREANREEKCPCGTQFLRRIEVMFIERQTAEVLTMKALGLDEHKQH